MGTTSFDVRTNSSATKCRGAREFQCGIEPDNKERGSNGDGRHQRRRARPLKVTARHGNATSTTQVSENQITLDAPVLATANTP